MNRYGDDPIDFGPAEDDYRGYDLQGEETARGPLILALAAGVLIVFGAVVWNTYRQGVRANPNALPVIAAHDGDYKRLPDNAGGRTMPDQELRFYDELDGSSRDQTAPMEELRRAVSARPEEALAGGGAGSSLPAPATGDEAAPLNADGSGLAAPIRSTLEDEPKIAVLDEATMALVAERATDFAAPPPGSIARAASTRSRFDFSADGAYMVQIAALRDAQGAEAAWQTLAGRYPEIFAGAEKRIQRADLGARGIFYRLRAGAFDDRSAAGEFCEALKSTGNDCIIVQ